MCDDGCDDEDADRLPAGDDDDDAWWLAADGDAVVLLSPAVSAATAAGVWRGLGAGGIGAVLEALTGAFGTSLTAIPPFALAIAEAGGARVAVRGDVEVVVEGDHPRPCRDGEWRPGQNASSREPCV